MSTALAIASVTAVLKDLLNNGLIDHNVSSSVGDLTVSALPPDRIDALDAEKKSRLNLFMYQVTPNTGWRNVGLPSRDGNGERISNSPLALDLHYLLTAYGAEELHAEILLGHGMQLLHETPVLPRAAIRKSLSPPSSVSGGGSLPPGMEALFTSELAEQVEQIRIVPQALSTEEVSRMWAAFGAKYRPTAAHQASVVLIESRAAARTALPVRTRSVHVVLHQQPVIERILSQEAPGAPILTEAPILAGHRLVVVGHGLRGESTRVTVGGVAVTPADKDIGVRQIAVAIPDTLTAGVQGVQVVHDRVGTPPIPYRAVESNLAAFILRPRIETSDVEDVQGSGDEPRSATVKLRVRPAMGAAQRVLLVLNAFSDAASPPAATAALAYTFSAPSRFDLQSPPVAAPLPSEAIEIPVRGVKAGAYLARIQVDGAESPLLADANGRYQAPQVVIP